MWECAGGRRLEGQVQKVGGPLQKDLAEVPVPQHGKLSTEVNMLKTLVFFFPRFSILGERFQSGNLPCLTPQPLPGNQGRKRKNIQWKELLENALVSIVNGQVLRAHS